jgi:hypothetical protein
MSGNLQTVDITALATYLEKVKEIASVSKIMGAVYLRDFIIGQDIAGQLVAKSIQADLKAKAKVDQAKSIAYLDRAADYLKERSIKDTSEARKMYIDLDPDVQIALDNKAKTEALVALMKNKLSVLRQAHDSLKKVIYGDHSGTQWEGM